MRTCLLLRIPLPVGTGRYQIVSETNFIENCRRSSISVKLQKNSTFTTVDTIRKCFSVELLPLGLVSSWQLL